MIYAVLKRVGSDGLKNKVAAISLSMRIPECRLSTEDHFESLFPRLKIFTNSKKQLGGFIACCEAGVDAVSIIEIPFEIKSDKYFMEFENAYLGCFLKKFNKEELVKRSELYVKMISHKPIVRMWMAQLDINVEKIRKSKMTIQDKSALIFQLQNEIDIKYKNLLKEIEILPKFLNRNF